jgi:transcriptional regulator with XRE-family HTH domain
MSVDHAAIIEALQAGEAQKAIARRLGCSPGTVNRLAKLNGLEPGSAKNQAAAAVVDNLLADYTLERRMALLNKVFDQAEAMIPTATTPHKLQALAIAIGILIDKRRLEDGEVTARTEVNSGSAREQLTRRLDELAARRAAAANPERAVG